MRIVLDKNGMYNDVGNLGDYVSDKIAYVNQMNETIELTWHLGIDRNNYQ